MNQRLVLLLMVCSGFSKGYATYNSPVGSASAGIAHASVAAVNIWSCFNNQAGLAFIRDVSAGMGYENRFLVKELGLKTGAVAFPVKGGTFGCSVSSFGYSLYNRNKYGLAFAKSFGEKLAAGIQVDYMTFSMPDNYGTTGIPLVEMGIWTKPLKNVEIGVHLYNPTHAKLSANSEERIPAILRMGFCYALSEKVALCAETTKSTDIPAQFRGGIDYKPSKVLHIRVGLAGGPTLLCFGFGIPLGTFTIDVASTYHTTLGFSPQLSLHWKAGRNNLHG